MLLFDSDHVHELHFTEGGNVVGDANGFTDEDLPAENTLEAAEWVAPKRWINIDEIAASPAEIDDEDECDTDFDFMKDEAGEPVLVFRRATRRAVIVVNNDMRPFVWPSPDEPLNSEINASPAEIMDEVEDDDSEPLHPEQSAVIRKVMEGSEGERREYRANHKGDRIRGKGHKLHKSRIALRRRGKTLRQKLDELAAEAIPAEVVMFPVQHWTEEEFMRILVIENDLEAEAWNAELDYLEWWHNHCYDYAEPEPTARERYEAQMREERQAWEDEMSDLGDKIEKYVATHGHFPSETHWDDLDLAHLLVSEDNSDEPLKEAQYSGVSMRDTMSSSRYSDFTQNRSGNYTRGSGTKWKVRKPFSPRERKRLARHAA